MSIDMTVFRTRILDDRFDGRYLWRSNWSKTLYRHHGGWWEMYQDGTWQRCFNENSNAKYRLIASLGEKFIRVGEVLT